MQRRIEFLEKSPSLHVCLHGCRCVESLSGPGCHAWAPLDVSASGSQDASCSFCRFISRMPWAPLDVSASGFSVARMPSYSFWQQKLQDSMGSSRRFGLRCLSFQDVFVLPKLQDAMGSSRRFGLRSPSSQDAFVLLFSPGCFEAPLELSWDSMGPRAT